MLKLQYNHKHKLLEGLLEQSKSKHESQVYDPKIHKDINIY